MCLSVKSIVTFVILPQLQYFRKTARKSKAAIVHVIDGLKIDVFYQKKLCKKSRNEINFFSTIWCLLYLQMCVKCTFV